MPLRPRAAALVLGLLTAGAAAAEEAATRPVQHVLISFDGANDVALWRRSRALGAETGARFTYFLSCVYLLSPKNKALYKGPGMKAGRSNVGFALSAEDVSARLRQIWLAHDEGHEVASHGCGHFDGKDWSKADWRAEFAAFSNILDQAWARNGGPAAPAGWTEFVDGIKGFRAPYLSAGKPLAAALEETGFTYDASGVSRGPAPARRSGALIRFELPMIPEGPSGRRVIAMDYNLFVRHSGGIENARRAAEFEERTYQALAAAFRAEYGGKRAPLQAGFHFTLMNGGAYWNALERFARDVCVRQDVRCTSYSGYLRETGQAEATAAGG
jgi:peptidoglycan/xylan/chitin deacetylase (PgdA/CDA1 family)